MPNDYHVINTNEPDWDDRLVHLVRDQALMDAVPIELVIPWFDPDDPGHHAGLDQVKESLRELYRSIGGDDLIFTLRRLKGRASRQGVALEVEPFDLPDPDI